MARDYTAPTYPRQLKHHRHRRKARETRPPQHSGSDTRVINSASLLLRNQLLGAIPLAAALPVLVAMLLAVAILGVLIGFEARRYGGLAEHLEHT